MKTLQIQSIRSIISLGKMSPAALIFMNFVDAITNTLFKIQTYIVYHDFKIDDAAWLNFDANVWAQLSHATYAPSVVQLHTPIVTPSRPITASPRFPTAAATFPHLMPGATRTSIAFTIYSTPVGNIPMATNPATPNNYSVVDPTTKNVTDFHKGAVLHLACESNRRSFYNDIFVQGAQYNIHVTDPDLISATVGATPIVMNPTTLRSTSVALYKSLKKEDMIDTSIVAASSIKNTSIYGFQILQLLISLDHPHFIVTSISTNPIPKYSNTKNLFKYCSAIQLYVHNNDALS